MEYEVVVSPFKYNDFEKLSKIETEQYFQWYINHISDRLHILEKYIRKEGEKFELDYTPKSLIPLWSWYEKKIEMVEKTSEEIENELNKYPDWMHSEIMRTKVSVNTLKYSWDIALYFAEVMIRNGREKVYWGYFTKPQKRMSVNEPTLLGFINDMDLNPRLIVMTCTRRSCRARDDNRLFDMYNIWYKKIN